MTLSRLLQTVVEQGGLQPGGLNFDAKVRRESTDMEDLFIAHIAAMDAFARGLRNAVRITEDGILAAMVKVWTQLSNTPSQLETECIRTVVMQFFLLFILA